MINLPEVTFINKSASDIEGELITGYQQASGRTLQHGDPVRLFLLSQAAYISQLVELVNATAKQNLVAYASTAHLDHLGAFLGVERLPASAAVTTLRFSIDAVMTWSVLIPKGTRVSVGAGGTTYATDNAAQIAVGSTYVDVPATCTETGDSGNDYAAGEVNYLVDPLNYVTKSVNIDTTAGGSDTESDDDFRQRIRMAPESFSVAGPVGAYEYWAKSANSSIIDVAVIGPEDEPGNVYVYPLMTGGELPTQAVLNQVNETLNDEKVRPLCDIVHVESPASVSYDTALTYYIATEEATSAGGIQAAVAEAVADWQVWQRSKLGRDINPSELIRRVMAAGAHRVTVTSPLHTALTSSQVAREGTTAVTFGGLEDG